jgi:hypothetical protein
MDRCPMKSYLVTLSCNSRSGCIVYANRRTCYKSLCCTSRYSVLMCLGLVLHEWFLPAFLDPTPLQEFSCKQHAGRGFRRRLSLGFGTQLVARWRHRWWHPLRGWPPWASVAATTPDLSGINWQRWELTCFDSSPMTYYDIAHLVKL